MRTRILAAALALAALAPVLPGRPAAAATTLALRCGGGGDVAAMENSYATYGGNGGCWAHLGYHTYDLRGVYRLGQISTNRVFSVEVQFSPPIELATPTDAAIVVESSVDGIAWTKLYDARYPLLISSTAILPARQALRFSFDAGGIEARYLRVRQPRSAAQGLSGYMDGSEFDVEAVPVTVSEPVPRPGVAVLTCDENIMERIWPEHPCWFGGINRYDTPSFFHTYPLGGEATLSRVSGVATFLPWRSDDYHSGSSRTEIAGYVQTSVNGEDWSTAATIRGTYGSPISFDIPLGSVTARYVRLVAEHHARYGDNPAPLKHARGMLLDSRIVLAGALPDPA